MRRPQCTADAFETLSPPAIAELSINEPGIDMLSPQLSHIPLREARDFRAIVSTVPLPFGLLIQSAGL
jgi:hypothetical protein